MAAPYHSIICCVDGSDASDRALDEAVRLRRLGPGILQVVHVLTIPGALAATPFAYTVPTPVLREEAERWLGDRLADVPEATAVYLEGYPPQAICEWATKTGADLIVAAAHRGLVKRAMLGSFAAYVAYHAPCPVLLVRPVPLEAPGDEAEAVAAPGATTG
jgi:nucleotide-binding universal stress UspA family protein